MVLKDIEKRFCEITKLKLDLTIFPFTKNTCKEQKQETIKALSKKFGFVPTPIHLVDRMIKKDEKNLLATSITCDFCSGVGQYTVRLLRYLKNKFDIDVEDFLTNNHYLTELQPENCAALVYIFGPNINLYVGDSMNLKYSTEDDKGILFFNDKTKVWEHNALIDGLLTKETFNTNKQFLSFIFNNYKDNNKIIDFVNKIKSSEIKLEQNEDEHVEEITVEKVPEVIEQIKEQDKPKEEFKLEQEEVKEEKVKVVKESKPKKLAKKKIGDNTKEEADDFFSMFGGLKPLKS